MDETYKMSEDYYQDGFNSGYGYHWKNRGHDYPQTDGDRYDYDLGREDGERRRKISDELDREDHQ